MYPLNKIIYLISLALEGSQYCFEDKEISAVVVAECTNTTAPEQAQQILPRSNFAVKGGNRFKGGKEGAKEDCCRSAALCGLRRSAPHREELSAQATSGS